jgi:hypothetical protein
MRRWQEVRAYGVCARCGGCGRARAFPGARTREAVGGLARKISASDSNMSVMSGESLMKKQRNQASSFQGVHEDAPMGMDARKHTANARGWDADGGVTEKRTNNRLVSASQKEIEGPRRWETVDGESERVQSSTEERQGFRLPKGVGFIPLRVTPELGVLPRLTILCLLALRSCPHPLSQIACPDLLLFETAVTRLRAVYFFRSSFSTYSWTWVCVFCRLHRSALRDPGHAVFVPVITVFLGFSALSCRSMSPLPVSDRFVSDI